MEKQTIVCHWLTPSENTDFGRFCLLVPQPWKLAKDVQLSLIESCMCSIGCSFYWAIHTYQFPSSPWASALDQHKVSALGSRVGWTFARNNERSLYRMSGFHFYLRINSLHFVLWFIGVQITNFCELCSPRSHKSDDRCSVEYQFVWEGIIAIWIRCDTPLISRYLIRCNVSCHHYSMDRPLAQLA